MSEWNIAPVTETTAQQPAARSAKRAADDTANFGQWLTRSIAEVDQMQQFSDTAAQRLIAGESKDIHGTMISMQKAGIALDLIVEIRNKVVAAYEEIKRMQF